MNTGKISLIFYKTFLFFLLQPWSFFAIHNQNAETKRTLDMKV